MVTHEYPDGGREDGNHEFQKYWSERPLGVVAVLDGLKGESAFVGYRPRLVDEHLTVVLPSYRAEDADKEVDEWRLGVRPRSKRVLRIGATQISHGVLVPVSYNDVRALFPYVNESYIMEDVDQCWDGAFVPATVSHLITWCIFSVACDGANQRRLWEEKSEGIRSVISEWLAASPNSSFRRALSQSSPSAPVVSGSSSCPPVTAYGPMSEPRIEGKAGPYDTAGRGSGDRKPVVSQLDAGVPAASDAIVRPELTAQLRSTEMSSLALEQGNVIDNAIKITRQVPQTKLGKPEQQSTIPGVCEKELRREGIKMPSPGKIWNWPDLLQCRVVLLKRSLARDVLDEGEQKRAYDDAKSFWDTLTVCSPARDASSVVEDGSRVPSTPLVPVVASDASGSSSREGPASVSEPAKVSVPVPVQGNASVSSKDSPPEEVAANVKQQVEKEMKAVAQMDAQGAEVRSGSLPARHRPDPLPILAQVHAYIERNKLDTEAQRAFWEIVNTEDKMKLILSHGDCTSYKKPSACLLYTSPSPRDS